MKKRVALVTAFCLLEVATCFAQADKRYSFVPSVEKAFHPLLRRDGVYINRGPIVWSWSSVWIFFGNGICQNNSTHNQPLGTAYEDSTHFVEAMVYSLVSTVPYGMPYYISGDTIVVERLDRDYDAFNSYRSVARYLILKDSIVYHSVRNFYSRSGTKKRDDSDWRAPKEHTAYRFYPHPVRPDSMRAFDASSRYFPRQR